MKTLALRAGLCALPLSASLFAAADARACGGCFHPENQLPENASVVTAHRMALSISPDASVLWDQVQYAGSPEEFAWVLPVKPGARLEIASDAWFEALDAATAVQIVPPTIQCVTRTAVQDPPEHFPPNHGCHMSGPALAAGCSASEPGRDVPGETREITDVSTLAPPEDPVTVVHQGSAGPYETVTLHSSVPGALNDWLAGHGYAVDASIQPILDAYAKDGFDFIALRLLPSKGVQQMKPVRVIQPGAVTALPLRMVAAGAGAYVGMTLFVIGEGRYLAGNFAEATIAGLPVWDFGAQRSDYASRREQAFANASAGASWLTTYASQGALFAPATRPDGAQVQYTTGNGAASTIADAFMKQAFADQETEIACSGIFGAIAASGDKVVDPCPPDGGECAELAEGELDARYFECGPLRDLAVGLVGLHPRDVWVTRLEANLPASALASDLVLAPAASQSPLSNYFVASSFVNAPCEVASATASAPRPGGRRGGGHVFLAFGAVIAAGAAARRLGRGRSADATHHR